jgi:hypothetical protein
MRATAVVGDGATLQLASTIILIPFVMIRGTHLPTLEAGLAFIPLQVLIAVVSPLAGMPAAGSAGACHFLSATPPSPWDAPWRSVSVRTRPIGRTSSPHPVAGAGHELGDRAVDDLSSSHPSSPIAPGTASGVNSAVSRAGSLFAIALLGGPLQQDGPQLFLEFSTW